MRMAPSWWIVLVHSMQQYNWRCEIRNSYWYVCVCILYSQKLKKAKQHAALQKHSGSGIKRPPPTKLATVVGGVGGMAVDNSTPARPPPVKKVKVDEPRSLFPSNGLSVSSSSLESHLPMQVQASVPHASSDSQIPAVIPVVNLSSKLNKKPTSSLSDGGIADKGQPSQVPKEPPVLPAKLPPVVLEKVTELEQVFCCCLAFIMCIHAHMYLGTCLFTVHSAPHN